MFPAPWCPSSLRENKSQQIKKAQTGKLVFVTPQNTQEEFHYL